MPEHDEHKPSRGDLMLLGRLTAAIDLLGRCGAESFTVEHNDESLWDVAGVQWRCVIEWSKDGPIGEDHRVVTEGYPYPAEAATAALARAINGGVCTTCGRTTVLETHLGDEYCVVTLHADHVEVEGTYRFRSACETAP